MIINNALPEPNAAKLGNVLIGENSSYCAVALFDNGIVYREAGQRLVVQYDDGTIVKFLSQTSSIFENNVYLSPQGFLIYLYRKTDNGWFLRSYNINTRSVIRDLFLVKDPGFPSIAIDTFQNRVIIYKADPRQTNIGYGFGFTWTTNVLESFYFGVYVQDVEMHLAFKNGEAGFYRSIYSRTTGQGKISQIGNDAIDGELYNFTPLQGETIVQDNNSDDLWWPIVTPDNANIFVINRAATEMSAWNTAVQNTQSVSPFQIDDRDNLYHADVKIGYPRLFITDKNILYDQRTLTAIDVDNLAEAQDYPICVNGLVTPYPTGTLNLLDRQTAYLQSNATKRACVLNEYYALDESESCLLRNNLIGEIEHTRYLKSDQADLENYLGKIVETGITVSVPTTTMIHGETGLVIYRGGSNYYYNDTLIGPTGVKFEFLITPNYLVFLRGENIQVFDRADNSEIASITLPRSIGIVRDMFVWNDKAYFRTSTSLIIYRLGETTITQGPLPDSIDVKLLANPFDGKLYLYDNRDPEQLYSLTTNLFLENYPGDYPIFSVEEPLAYKIDSFTGDFSIRWLTEDLFFIVKHESNSIQLSNGKQIAGLPATEESLSISYNNYFTYGPLLFFYNGDDFRLVSSNISYESVTPGLKPYNAATVVPNGVWGEFNSQLVYWDTVGRVYEFNKPGQRQFTNIFTETGAEIKSHMFGVQFNNVNYVKSFDQIIDGGYQANYLIDTKNSFSNDFTKIDSYKRQNNRIAYQVSYYATEEDVAFFSNLFHAQGRLLSDLQENFRVEFLDNYKEQFAGFHEVLLTSVYFEWFHKGVYLLTLSFETI